jgi:hypothetical protein
MAQLLSVSVGLPRDISWRGERVFTSVWEQPVQGRHMVRRLNVGGDGQGDLLSIDPSLWSSQEKETC